MANRGGSVSGWSAAVPGCAGGHDRGHRCAAHLISITKWIIATRRLARACRGQRRDGAQGLPADCDHPQSHTTQPRVDRAAERQVGARRAYRDGGGPPARAALAAMPSVQFKLKSARDFERIDFSGMFITVVDLKRAIIEQKLKSAGDSFGLVLSNAQTGEGRPRQPAGCLRPALQPDSPAALHALGLSPTRLRPTRSIATVLFSCAEYLNESFLVPANTSVLVRRVPLAEMPGASKPTEPVVPSAATAALPVQTYAPLRTLRCLCTPLRAAALAQQIAYG